MHNCSFEIEFDVHEIEPEGGTHFYVNGSYLDLF